MKRLTRKFPSTRSRRLRKNQVIRDLVSDVSINKSKLIQPLFVSDENSKNIDLDSMPGQKLFSKQGLLKEVDSLLSLGINTIAIFPNLTSIKKDLKGSEAINPENFICKTIRVLKERFPEVIVISDVALDPYTSTGHDGIVIKNNIDNDETLKMLQKMSINLTASGTDILAPSDMMDGRIGEIRLELDNNSLKEIKILSYAVKYASSFYGPFRDAVGSKKSLKGDKKTYQMDFSNSEEALREVALDIKEGADLVMVKPGLPYLDIIKKVKENFKIPVLAYQVSGEYSLLMNGINKGLINENSIYETLMSFKRAGANAIISYFADRIDKIIKN